MAFLVGSLKIIISDVPDNVKLQVCVTVALRWHYSVTEITAPPLTPPLPPQTQRGKLLARESLFEKELKLATEKNIQEDTSDSLQYSQSGSGQR